MSSHENISIGNVVAKRTSKNGEAALFYASLGYSVFPCRVGDKRPDTAEGFKDATTDEQQISEVWWYYEPDRNIGIATTGLLVVDIDPGANWPDSSERARQLHAAPTSVTPRGGRHHIFRDADRRYRCSTSVIAPNVDIRATGGYFVAAPSQVGGKPYRWLNPLDCPPEELPPPPEWLREALHAQPSMPSPQLSVVICTPQAQVAQAISALWGLGAHRAGNYDDWLHVGMALHSVDPSGAMLMQWDEWSRSRAPGKYESGECEHKWRSFAPDGGIGIGSLIQWAHADGWSLRPSSEPIHEALPLDTLVQTHGEMRPARIEGVLRDGETACINAKAKMRKSWTAYGMAICVAAGLYWLGKFRCKRGRVLIIDCELHPETLAKRIPAVADAMDVKPPDYHGQIDVLSMRGQLQDIFKMEPLFDRIASGEYALVILDALYRVLPPNWSENDNAQMAQVFNKIDEYARRTGAAFLVIHHQSKGNQSERDVVDVGSGASAFARAVDAHLVLRQHENGGHAVLDGALRSWEPMEPIVLKWEFPVWQVVQDGDPTALKGSKTKGVERQTQNDAKGIAAIKSALRLGPATPRSLRDVTGIGKDRMTRLLEIMSADGTVSWTPRRIKGNDTRMYELSSS